MMESLSWSQGAARSPHRKTRRRARNDRSNELEFLRNKVRQMEEELRVLHLQRLNNLVPATLPSSPAVTLDFSSQMFGFPMSSPAAPPIWDIAARHQRRSERAASENTRLHMVLDTQVSLARRLKSQLGKRIRGHRGPSFVLETETAESLRYGLNTALEELDAVFDTNGLGRLETPSTEARIREAASGMYLDIYVATLLPFDFMTTATAVWNHYRGIGRRRGSLNQNSTLDDESDTVIEEVAVKFTGKSTNADFRVKQAIQRHMEPDRQVVVWVSKAEAVEQQMSAYSKFALVDKGYVVVKRPALLEQGQTPSTLLQICCLISQQMTRGCVLDH
ncbi:M96 mating-specific protein family [Phytophthora infestans T30-4]|uniref:M96 mating-specific protein family n=1 Tax=Phytophthora infestans (strain T30-4) TaxID=403677 RepID=D0NTI3_PHYIT|nr:M96 mating-specific protein family [Phytophthora infestans T30-4]EEY64934.1 M96 mating-specific protein family [Phytophthora infestans T30-4]|eukprot:XP_002897664.1 M96 mating-specific protein family [Phytophthora infestans T30-4]